MDDKRKLLTRKPLRIQSPWGKAWTRFRHHKLAFMGMVIFMLLVLSSILAPFVSYYPPNKMDLGCVFSPPNYKHWFGTDGIGRDIWARTLYGGRISISVGIASVLISTTIAVLLGGLAGYYGGKIDLFIMRLIDIAMSVPPLVLMMALIAVVGPSFTNVILAIGLLGWPGIARIVRGEFLSLREQDFVVAAHSLGLSDFRIIFRHVLPNSLAPLIVAATLQMASAILTEAALSFLGIGVPPPTPSWGNMLQAAQTITTLEGMPWLWVTPGVAIIVCVLSINFIGDGLRDALDPHALM